MGTTDTKPDRASGNLPGMGILLVVLTVLAYLPVMHGGFIWDDDALITENRMIKADDGLRQIWLTAKAPDWRLTSSACWLEWRLWGNDPTGYHVVNVLLHAINAVLVWVILRRLKVPGAWLTGCVFALHPVNVATVAWISEQKNTLSMLFYGIAILLYLRFEEAGGWRWYGFSLGAFLLALLSKTAVVMLPVVLLGCIWWMRGRVRREDLLRSLPFFVLSLVMGLVTIWYQHPRAAAGQAIQTEGFLTRLAVAGLTPWFYLWKTLLPINLTVVYPKWDIDTSSWISFLPGILLVGCLTLFWWRRKSWGRPWFFGLGCFVATLFPVSGFFHQTFHEHSFVADHLLYHSIASVIALAVATGVAICRRLGQRGRPVGAVAGVAVLMVLGAATWSRSGVYADGETLWRDTVAKNPGAWVAYYNLGLNLERAGKMDDAIAQYEHALQTKPNFAEAHYCLAHALEKTGVYRDVVAHYELALRFKPDYPKALNNLAWLLATREPAGSTDPGRAVALAERACKLSDPPVATYLDTLAAAYAAAGRFGDAVITAQKAVELARAGDEPDTVGKIESRLQLYRAGRAYRQFAGVTP